MASDASNLSNKEREFIDLLRKEKDPKVESRSAADWLNALRQQFAPKPNYSSATSNLNKEEFKIGSSYIEKTSAQLADFVKETKQNVLDSFAASQKIIEFQSKQYRADLEELNNTLDENNKKSKQDIESLVKQFKNYNEDLVREKLREKRPGVEVLPNALTEGISKQQKAWGEIFDFFRKTKEDVVNKFVPSEDKGLFSYGSRRNPPSSVPPQTTPIEPIPAEPIPAEPFIPENEQKLLPYRGPRALLPYKNPEQIEDRPPVQRKALPAPSDDNFIDVETVNTSPKLLPYGGNNKDAIIIVDELKRVESSIKLLPEKLEDSNVKLAEKVIQLNEEEKPIGDKKDSNIQDATEIKEVSDDVSKSLTSPVIKSLDSNFEKLVKEVKRLRSGTGEANEEQGGMLDDLLGDNKKGIFNKARSLGKKGLNVGKNLMRGTGNLISSGVEAATGGAGVLGLLGTEVGSIGALGAGAVASSLALGAGAIAGGGYVGYQLEEKYGAGTKILEQFNILDSKDSKEKEQAIDEYNSKLTEINEIPSGPKRRLAKMQLDLITLKKEAESATGEEKAQKNLLISRVEKSIEKLTAQQEKEAKAVEAAIKAPEPTVPDTTVPPAAPPTTTGPAVTEPATQIKAEIPEKVEPKIELPAAVPTKTGEDLLKGVEKGLLGTELTTVNDNLEKLLKVMIEKDMGTTVIAGDKAEKVNAVANYTSSRVLSLRDQLRPA